MNKFYEGFEKGAGFGDFFAKIKKMFSGKDPVPTKEMDRKFKRQPVKYFRKKNLNPSTVKMLNRSIRSNKKNIGEMVTLKYKKANGEVVTRKVTPYTAKNKNLLLGHDHHRDELRSYRADRILSIK